MAKRILAPIDARERSEAIAPVVAALARDGGATVRLLRVVPIPDRVVGSHGRTVAYADQEMARLTAEGLDDLGRIEAQLAGVPVESVVRFGEPVEEIVLEAEAFDADLIVLAAERRGWLARLRGGGLSERLLHASPVPVALVRAA